MNEVNYFLDGLKINENDPLVVAVSFGPDSMFLLNLLKNKYKNNKIICAHVNHNHRKESKKEEEDLKKYCLENNVIFELMKIEKYKNDKFTEEEAREKRYKFFDTLMKKYNSKYLFTAHHGDDLTETILMRISRGSNLNGYAGIKLISKRDNYNIVRPLLYLTKDYIKKYLDDNNISYAIDCSNDDLKYTRNRFRNNILPYLKKENKNIHKKFLAFSYELNSYNEFVNDIVNEEYKKVVKDNEIIIDKIKKEKSLIIRKIIELYLFNIYNKNINKINKSHVKKIVDMIYNKRTTYKIMLPDEINIIKSYNKIYFDKKKEYNSYCYCLNDYVKLPNGYVIKKIDKAFDTSNYTACFLSSEVKLPLYVRNKRNKDSMEILNLNGTKKVKDILINSKVDKEKRNLYPIVTDKTGKIIWLPGLKKSKYDRSKRGNYDIILKYYKEDL